MHFEPFFYVPLPRGATPSTTTIKVHQGFPWPSLRPVSELVGKAMKLLFMPRFPIGKR